MDGDPKFRKSGFFGRLDERRGYHHGRLKEALLEAARGLLSERGGGSPAEVPDQVRNKETDRSERVRLAGERYKEFVALGALKAARGARDNQWQTLIG